MVFEVGLDETGTGSDLCIDNRFDSVVINRLSLSIKIMAHEHNELPMTDRIRSVLIATRRVNAVKDQLNRAEMTLNKLIGKLSGKELTLYHKHIGLKPIDRRYDKSLQDRKETSL